MSRRGFPAEPAGLKLLKGNPGRRPLRATASVPAGMPEPLVALSGAAQACWDTLVPLAAEVGLATALDACVWTLYCEAWGRSREIHAVLDRDGVVLASGAVHPLLKPALDLAATLRLLGAEVGLSPASRCRIKVDSPASKSKMDLFREKHGDHS